MEGGQITQWKFAIGISCYSPFAPSGPNYLNFQLPVERRPQSQPLEDVFL